MAEKVPISVLIPVKNEAANLEACLASVAFCDEIVVVDSASSDGTREIAGRAGVRLVDFHWDGRFPKKKNWALIHVPWKHPWVFIIDADERVTPALAAEMRAAVAQTSHQGFYVNRRFWFLDGWLNHCGYFPSWNLRLLRHGQGHYEKLAATAGTGSGDNEVHEHIQLNGTAGYLQAPMEHYAFPDIATWVEKHNRYSNWEARLQVEAQAPAAPPDRALPASFVFKRRLRRLAWALPFRPTQRFFYHYVLRCGFLDGYRGFVFCRLMGWYEFLSASKARELRRAARPRS